MSGTTRSVAPASLQPRVATSAAPCFVTAERHSARHVLVDLVAAGVTVLRGTPEAVDERLRQLVGEAVTGRWSPPRRVAVAGLSDPPAGARRLDLDAAPDRRDGGVIVLGARCAADERVERVLAAARAGEGPPLVLGWVVPAPGAEITVWENACAEPSPAAPELGPGEPGPHDAVEVAVLGPVAIHGTGGFFSRRPKLTELVVYLALHPGGVTTAAWTSALWPDRARPGQTISNRASEARRALGVAEDGRRRLRKTGDRLRVVGVDTDWARFQDLSDPNGDLPGWRGALELVRGRPFEGLPECQWCYLEGFVAEMEVAIVELGIRLGERLLAAGDAVGAQWAAARALKACPFDERLHRLLMRAADAGGNRGLLDEVLRQLALVLELDGDPRLGVHPETAALYDQLAGRSLRRGPARGGRELAGKERMDC